MDHSIENPPGERLCLRCRSELAPKALFCSKCGFPIQSIAPSEPSPASHPDAAPEPAAPEPAVVPAPEASLVEPYAFSVRAAGSDTGAPPRPETPPVPSASGSSSTGPPLPDPAAFISAAPVWDRKFDTGPLGGYVSAEALDAPEFAPGAPPFTGPEPPAGTGAQPEAEETRAAPEPSAAAAGSAPPEGLTYGIDPHELVPAPMPPLDPNSPSGLPPLRVPVPHGAPEQTPLPSSPTRRLLSTGDFVLIELLSWIPVVNVIIFLVFMFRRDGNITRIRLAQAKLLTWFILLLAAVVVLGVLTLLVYSGVLDRLPFPAIYFQ